MEENLLERIDLKEGSLELFLYEATEDKAILELIYCGTGKGFLIDMSKKTQREKLRRILFDKEIDSAFFTDEGIYGMEVAYKDDSIIHIYYAI